MKSSSRDVKNTFQRHGLAPKKWMGQNLLVDSAYLERIVHAADITPGEPVVEVGAGLGVLTEALLEAGARVWALEVDSGFFEALREKLDRRDDLQLVHVDALKFDFAPLAAELGRLKVVANLPYNISSRLVFLFHENRALFRSLYVLLQTEVAERLIAEPGTKDYGVLTALLGVSAEVRLRFRIPGTAFYPRPKVSSTLVEIHFPETPPVPAADSALLTRLVKASFAGRRKTLRNTLKNNPALGLPFESIADAADAANIDLGRRGETLTPVEFARLSDELAKRQSDEESFSA